MNGEDKSRSGPLDKLGAGLAAITVVLPICSVCVLGTAAVGAMLTGVVAGLGGTGGVLSITLTIIAAGLLIYRIMQRRRALPEDLAPGSGMNLASQRKPDGRGV